MDRDERQRHALAVEVVGVLLNFEAFFKEDVFLPGKKLTEDERKRFVGMVSEPILYALLDILGDKK